MRHLLIATAALAVGGLLASTAARADLAYQAGGPIKQGEMCQVNADPGNNDGFGYWAPCPNQPVQTAKRAKKTRS